MNIQRNVTLTLANAIDIEQELRRIVCSKKFYEKFVRFDKQSNFKASELPITDKQKHLLKFLGITHGILSDMGEYNQITFYHPQGKYVTENAE